MLSEKEKEEFNRRGGTFYVSRHMIHHQTEQVVKLFEGMIVIECRYAFDRDGFVYTALSPKFSVVKENERFPEYEYKVDRKGNYVWDFR